MKYDNRPTNPRCEKRGCDQRARWDRLGPARLVWFSLCDKHFGQSLREDARLRSLAITAPEPVVTATVAP